MMTKPILAALLLLGVVATARSATQTNVLQNISLQFTVYQQGAVTGGGKKLGDKVSSYSTKDFIAAMEAVTGTTFGNGAKLVQVTTYSNLTVATGPGVLTNVFSTNVSMATNAYLEVGNSELLGSGFGDSSVTISNNVIETGTGGTVTSGAVTVITLGTSTNLVTTLEIGTNFITTLTPSPTNGAVTNVQIVTQQIISNAPTSSVFTNVATSIDILYGAANNLLPVSDYISTSTNSPEVVVESGEDLGETNAIITAQSGVSINNLSLDYFTTANSANNLNIYFTGFVKQSMKVDTLSSTRGNKVVEDILGGSSTWSVIGSGYSGGGFTTNSSDPTAIPVGNTVSGNFVTGFLTNTTPVVVQGTVNISFLKNLAQ